MADDPIDAIVTNMYPERRKVLNADALVSIATEPEALSIKSPEPDTWTLSRAWLTTYS